MSFFEWTPVLDVKVVAMNNEHKQLIDIMNRLHDLNEKSSPKAEIAKVIKELGAFTVKHFANEEAYMESIHFPNLDTHKRIHADLLQKFGEQATAFDKGTDGKVPAAFFSFLKLWLNAHIQGIDTKYGNHKH